MSADEASVTSKSPGPCAVEAAGEPCGEINSGIVVTSTKDSYGESVGDDASDVFFSFLFGGMREKKNMSKKTDK